MHVLFADEPPQVKVSFITEENQIQARVDYYPVTDVSENVDRSALL